MKIIHDCEKQEFVMFDEENQFIGKITYVRGPHNEMMVPHTEVKPAYEGRGYAGQLLDALVECARNENVKVIPICPYVVRAFRKSPAKYAAVMK